MERLQVRLEGLTDGRHALHLQRPTVPLRATGTPGEFVAGIRYRAWSPPSALHPTIGVDTPLHFAIVDAWNQTMIGGCTYHVVHPGGRSYEVFPVNALEAEARRHGRFEEQRHISQQGPSDTQTTGSWVPPETMNTPIGRGRRELVVLPPDAPVPGVIPDLDADLPHTFDLRRRRPH